MNETVQEVLRSLPVHLGNDLVFPGINGRQLLVTA